MKPQYFLFLLQGQSRLQYSGINNALEIKGNGKQKFMLQLVKKCEMSKGYGKTLPVNTISSYNLEKQFLSVQATK